MLSILYNIVISPIELVVEVVFELMWRLVGQHETNQGIAVIGVSVAISILTLPLYRRADVVQQKERDLQQKLSRWVNHIKKTFKGDERFMMLQAYYRENGYSPLYALNGSISLLLEIPFFIAAYHFLSHLEVLKGASFGMISDLGAPDGLVHFGSVSVNLLPILMTAINCVSAAVYLKGFPIKDKIQTYGMALIFLVFLYDSPAGLVVYWTCNNIFSLVKNIFYKLKDPRKTVAILCAGAGTLMTILLILSGILNSRKKYLVVELFQICMLIPLIFSILSKNRENLVMAIKSFFRNYRTQIMFFGILVAFMGMFVSLAMLASGIVNSQKKFFLVEFFQICTFIPLTFGLLQNGTPYSKSKIVLKDSPLIFICACAILSLLTGLVAPSNIIASSPTEFILEDMTSPIQFLPTSFFSAFGLFLFWPAGIRLLFRKSKSIFILDYIFVGMAFCALINLFIFPMRGGILTSLLKYEEAYLLKLSEISDKRLVLNILFPFGLFAGIYLVARSKISQYLKMFSAVIVICLLGLGIHNSVLIQRRYVTYKANLEKSKKELESKKNMKPIFHFSKTGKNVLCIMLDRAASPYLPYIFEENTRLYEEYEGFTYYPNTVSFSLFTLAGSPPLYGGYEYVPALQNQDDSKTLLEKREEAISMLPRLFAQNGYSATMTDMPWIGETEKSDFYFMNRFEEKITSIPTGGRYLSAWKELNGNISSKYYQQETLNRVFLRNGILSILPYIFRSPLYDKGRYMHTESETLVNTDEFPSMVNDYSFLDFLPVLSDTNSTSDSFMFIQNPMPHHPSFLQYPDYTIRENIVLDEKNPLSHDPHYHVNAASLLLLGKWIRWMKEEGIYDNTRIIISSDHGAHAVVESNLLGCSAFPRGEVNPLLLVKDFNERGDFKVKQDFMTNADVPTIAVQDVIEKPNNPATGKDFSKISLKNPAYIELTDWQETKHKLGDVDSPTKFFVYDDTWWACQGNIHEKENWQQINEKIAQEGTNRQSTVNMHGMEE